MARILTATAAALALGVTIALSGASTDRTPASAPAGNRLGDREFVAALADTSWPDSAWQDSTWRDSTWRDSLPDSVPPRENRK
jgi:hypothetical protein